MESHDSGVSRLLRDVADGRDGARDELLQEVYEELKAMARARVVGHGSVDATALVHEAYLRFFADNSIGWENRRHFFGTAARAMRDIVVELLRRNAARKRGGHMRRVLLESGLVAKDANLEDALALDTALEKLHEISPRSEEVVLLRYYADLTLDETARALEVPVSAVRAEWKYAKAFLHGELRQRNDSTI